MERSKSVAVAAFAAAVVAVVLGPSRVAQSRPGGGPPTQDVNIVGDAVPLNVGGQVSLDRTSEKVKTFSVAIGGTGTVSISQDSPAPSGTLLIETVSLNIQVQPGNTTPGGLNEVSLSFNSVGVSQTKVYIPVTKIGTDYIGNDFYQSSNVVLNTHVQLPAGKTNTFTLVVSARTAPNQTTVSATGTVTGIVVAP
jgi:hypothetical protein